MRHACDTLDRYLSAGLPPPPGTFSNDWGQFWLSQLEVERFLVASSRLRPGILLGILQYTGRPSPERMFQSKCQQCGGGQVSHLLPLWCDANRFQKPPLSAAGPEWGSAQLGAEGGLPGWNRADLSWPAAPQALSSIQPLLHLLDSPSP